MNPKIRGAVCGIASAAFYGCNPLGALGLYELGINAHTVLFFRFLLASLILAGMMLVSLSHSQRRKLFWCLSWASSSA